MTFSELAILAAYFFVLSILAFFVAQLTFHVGLLVAVTASPWARSLFLG